MPFLNNEFVLIQEQFDANVYVVKGMNQGRVKSVIYMKTKIFFSEVYLVFTLLIHLSLSQNDFKMFPAIEFDQVVASI